MKNYGWLWWAFIIPAIVLGGIFPAFGRLCILPVMIAILVAFMGLVVPRVIINYVRMIRRRQKYGREDPYLYMEEFRPRGNGLGMGD